MHENEERGDEFWGASIKSKTTNKWGDFYEVSKSDKIENSSKSEQGGRKLK